MDTLRVLVQAGYERKLPSNWRRVGPNLYELKTHESLYWQHALKHHKFVLEISVRTLAQGFVSVYSSSHGERNVRR